MSAWKAVPVHAVEAPDHYLHALTLISYCSSFHLKLDQFVQQLINFLRLVSSVGSACACSRALAVTVAGKRSDTCHETWLAGCP